MAAAAPITIESSIIDHFQALLKFELTDDAARLDFVFNKIDYFKLLLEVIPVISDSIVKFNLILRIHNLLNEGYFDFTSTSHKTFLNIETAIVRLGTEALLHIDLFSLKDVDLARASSSVANIMDNVVVAIIEEQNIEVTTDILADRFYAFLASLEYQNVVSIAEHGLVTPVSKVTMAARFFPTNIQRFLATLNGTDRATIENRFIAAARAYLFRAPIKDLSLAFDMAATPQEPLTIAYPSPISPSITGGYESDHSILPIAGTSDAATSVYTDTPLTGSPLPFRCTADLPPSSPATPSLYFHRT